MNQVDRNSKENTYVCNTCGSEYTLEEMEYGVECCGGRFICKTDLYDNAYANNIDDLLERKRKRR